MMERIDTPLGTVGLWLDDSPCAHDGSWEVYDRSDYALRHPVDGNVRIAYWHEPDGADHVLECGLDPSQECEGGSAGGERLEATVIDGGGARLVIAVECDFEDCAHGHGEHEYDYRAAADGLAVTVELPAGAKAQWIVFGVAWVDEVDGGNGTNPWLVGDPLGDRLRLPVGIYEKDGSGPYGGRTIEWFLPIEQPWERRDDVLALFEDCQFVERTNADEGYEDLEDIETIVEITNPHSENGISLGFCDDYTLGFGGTHWHYEAYEGDYDQLKADIKSILAGDLRMLSSRAEKGHWKGAKVIEGELVSETDGWAVLRSMGLGPEYEDHYAKLGGVVDVVSWLPDRCLTLRVEPRA